jgi:hypothetical protein
MDGWKGRLEQGVEKGKGVTPGAWTTRSNVQITDKRKRTNKEQRRQERMYSTGVDYSTLSISSLQRHEEEIVLLSSPPAGATSNMDKATHRLKKRGLDTVKKKIIFCCRPCYDQTYNCNLEISPTQAIIKRNCQNEEIFTLDRSIPGSSRHLHSATLSRDIPVSWQPCLAGY